VSEPGPDVFGLSKTSLKKAAMARKPGSNPQAIKNRAAKTAAAMSAPAAAAQNQSKSPPKKKTSLSQFAKEVRAEARKITWTSRKETWITSVMVAIMVTLTAIFFTVVDAGLQFGVTQILKLATAG
jgi:preprotein translocase subunit SecE